MSQTTVPRIFVSGSEASFDAPTSLTTLRFHRRLGDTDVPGADVVLTEEAAVEVITDLVLALRRSSAHAGLAAAVDAYFDGLGAVRS